MRIYIGRKRDQKPGKGLAAALGLNPSQVTQMLRPGGRSIKVHEMPVICEYIGREPQPDVLSGVFQEAEHQAGARAMTPARVRVRIVGTHAQGMWKSRDSEPPAQGNIAIMEDPDQRLEGLEQFGVWIDVGRSCVICVDYFQIRTKPLAGDKVFVRRITSAGLMEETIRRVDIVRGNVRLVLNGQVPKGADKSVAYPAENPAEKVEIVGLVIGSYAKEF